MSVRTQDDAPAIAAGVTPMMAQYLACKAEASDALLFYRMGDFFELFFEDAEKAAAALDIALTKRGKHLGQDIPMCGVPVATAEAYLARLIQAGFRVAVAEQTEDPKEARKRGPKSVVARAIVRVVTPGTITEEGLLDARASAFIAALAPAKAGVFGLAWADVSTGEFLLAAVEERALEAELAALAPRELLTPDDLAGPAREASEGIGGALTPLPRVKFSADGARRRLKDLFGVDALDGFGDLPAPALAAAGALVDYLQLTQAGAPAKLGPPRAKAVGAHMAIDPATRASLEIDRTLRGARKGALLHAIDRTVTGPGARALAQRLARPSTDVDAIAARLDAVEFLLLERDLRADLRQTLKAAGDAPRALSRLLLGRGGPRDLAALARALKAGEEVSALFGARPIATPPGEIKAALDAASLADKPALAALMRDAARSLVAEPPLLARDGGFIAAGVDPALDEARALRDESRRVIAGLQATYAQDAAIPSLKIKHNNVLGYFIETSAKAGEPMMRAPLNQTFIHRQTMASAVRFSTVELSALEAKIAGAAERARAIEVRLFESFLERVIETERAIRVAADALASLDVAAGLADWAEEAGATRPMVDASHAFEVEGGRHPVVEAALAAERAGPFTPNDCRLDGAGGKGPRLLLVTGPNMAGKSTYLRQNALIAILAQAGSFVPAKAARIGVVDRVFSRVGAADDLARGRSTFMAEMLETAAILNQAGPRAFVILDEIGRGTATWDGLAIAWATAEHLHEVNGSRALFATHYHEMTRLAEDLPHAANACLKAKEWKGDLVFLHEVGPGAADRSYGVEVAKRAGMPRAAVARARALLKRLEAGSGPGDALGGLPLFAASEPPPPPEPSAALAALAGVEPDALAPREALDLLYRLKKLAEDEA